MQDILDKNNPLLCYTLSDNSSSEGSNNDEDDDIPWDNMNHSKSKEELEDFERFKRKKYQPNVRGVTARCLTGELCQIIVSPVDQKGKNLPSGHNLFDYIDVRGCIDFVQFSSDHSKSLFPILWMIAQHDYSSGGVEVGCEHFFVYLGTFHCLDKQD
jgi:hypothetical protein